MSYYIAAVYNDGSTFRENCRSKQALHVTLHYDDAGQDTVEQICTNAFDDHQTLQNYNYNTILQYRELTTLGHWCGIKLGKFHMALFKYANNFHCDQIQLQDCLTTTGLMNISLLDGVYTGTRPSSLNEERLDNVDNCIKTLTSQNQDISSDAGDTNTISGSGYDSSSSEL